MAASAEALIAEYASTPTPPSPPPSLLTLLSSPLPQIPLPPLPLPSPPTHTSPTYAEAPLGYRATMIKSRAVSPSHVPSPLLFKAGESSTAAATRQAGHTLSHRVDCRFIDTMNPSIHAYESRVMTAVREVSLLTREGRYFHLMASSSEHEVTDARRAWIHSKSRSQAMEAQIRALQRDVDVLQRQRIRDEDRLMGHIVTFHIFSNAPKLIILLRPNLRGVTHIQHEHDRFRELVHTVEAGPGMDQLMLKMPPKRTTTPMFDAAIKALGTKGVVGLTQWFEIMESVFYISNCTVAYQIKFATCTLFGNSLTWWNSHVKTVGHDAAYRMPWKIFIKMMTDKYCPRGEIKKLEIEL
ncbi:hypothetical protein Tco_1533466 [Tanacetum coccineum]